MTVKIRPYRKGGHEVDIMITLPNGKTHRERRKSPVTTRAGSLRWGKEREAHLLLHGPTPRGPAQAANDREEMPTFAEFAPRYLEGYCKANGFKPSTCDNAERVLRVHLLPVIGETRLDRLTNEDVQRLKAKLAGKANKTINNILATLNTLLKCAVDWGLLESKPVTVTRLRVAKTRMDFYSFEDYETLLAGAEALGPQHLAMVLLGGDAGLRAGEMRALHWSSIDWNVRQLTVERSEWHGQLTTPKHDKIRTVPMTERLTAALQALPRESATVLTEKGVMLTKGYLRGRLRRVCRQAEIRDRGPHTLRHTFCSHLAMRAVPARVIQQLAGHSNLVTTERYMHLSPGAAESAIAALEAPPPGQTITPRDEGDHS